MVNKPLIRPYFLGGVALGGVARIPMMKPIDFRPFTKGFNFTPFLTIKLAPVDPPNSHDFGPTLVATFG